MVIVLHLELRKLQEFVSSHLENTSGWQVWVDFFLVHSQLIR